MERLRPFSHLKDIVGPCTLQCIGATYFNELNPTVPNLECIYSTRFQKQVSIAVAVGYQPYIWPGQQYNKGEKTSKDNSLGTLRLTFNTKDAEETVLSETVPNFYLTEDFSYVRGMPVKKIPTPDHFSIPYCIIPESEILRFYYSKSTDLAIAIFNGHFSEALISKYIINTKHEKPRFIGDTYRFMYRHGFSHCDALIIGRILASEEALSSVRRVHNSLVKDYINNSTYRAANFRTGFPFSGETTLLVDGYTDFGNRAIFVNRILSCSGPFPFASLSHCDELQAGNPNPDGETFKMPRKGKSWHSENKNGEATSTTGPDSAVKEVTLNIMSGEQTGAKEIDIRSEKFAESTFNFDKQADLGGATAEPKDVSTGKPKDNGTGKGKQNIQDAIIPEHSKEMANIVRAVQSLKSKKSIVSIKSLNLCNGAYNSDLEVYVFPFPLVNCQHKSRKRIFSYLNSHSSQVWKRRIAVCFEIQFENRRARKIAYLFATEKREVKNSELPIGILHRKNGQQLPEKFLTDFLTETVKIKNWKKYPPTSHFNTDTVGIGTIKNMAKDILNSLEYSH
jgi:hypothetical protein